jgi:anti-sigma factor RsiW
MSCDDRFEQVSALLDGELAAAELGQLTAHLAACPACAQLLAELGALRAALAQAVPEEEISGDFLRRVETALAAEPQPAPRVLAFRRRRVIGPFALGAAAAAIAAMLFTTLQPAKNIADLAAVRDAALRGNAAIGVSVPAAPPPAGYSLAFARSDVVAGHAAEVLTYTRQGQPFTLCIWKANGEPPHGLRQGRYRGMNIAYWNDGREEYWVAAEQPAAAVAAFAGRVKAGQG